MRSIVCRIVGCIDLVIKSLFIEYRGKDSDETRQVRSWCVSETTLHSSFAEQTSLFETISFKVQVEDTVELD